MLIGTIFYTCSLYLQSSENAQYSSFNFVFMCQPKGKSHLEDLSVDGHNIKLIKQGWWMSRDSSGSE